MTVQETAQQVNGLFCEILAEWFQHSGRAREVDAYYKDRLARTNVIGPSEMLVARHMVAHYPPGTTVCEIGAGYGQLAVLMAFLGYPAIAIDGQDWRKEGTVWISDRLKQKNPAEMALFRPMGGWFPKDFVGLSYDVLLASNVVNGIWGAAGITLKESLRDRDCVIDTRLWWSIRDKEPEREGLIADIKTLGYEGTRIEGTIWAFKKTVSP